MLYIGSITTLNLNLNLNSKSAEPPYDLHGTLV